MARAEEVASPCSVLETAALLLSYALMFGAGREDRTRMIGLEDRCLCHSARPARNIARELTVLMRSNGGSGTSRTFIGSRPGGLQPLGVASPAMPNRNWYLRDESNVPSGIRSPSAGVPRRRCVVPCPWNQTWSSRAYKARAVSSGPQGMCHSVVQKSNEANGADA